MNYKNLHLFTSICTIVVVGIIYGLLPNGFLPKMFHFNIENIDLANVFRAIMGLYMAMGIFWLLGIIKPTMWYAATLSNVLLMAGLAIGRIISLITDGIPSIVFIVGLLGEIGLAFWGYINLKKYKM